MAAVTALTAPASPWLTVPPLTGLDYELFRREAIFACRKWDAQVEDVASIAPAPLVLRAGVWRELVVDAERLYAEALLAEGALVARPDLLILDEPTNHLDADTIAWLEGYLTSYTGA